MFCCGGSYYCKNNKIDLILCRLKFHAFWTCHFLLISRECINGFLWKVPGSKVRSRRVHLIAPMNKIEFDELILDCGKFFWTKNLVKQHNMWRKRNASFVIRKTFSESSNFFPRQKICRATRDFPSYCKTNSLKIIYYFSAENTLIWVGLIQPEYFPEKKTREFRALKSPVP